MRLSQLILTCALLVCAIYAHVEPHDSPINLRRGRELAFFGKHKHHERVEEHKAAEHNAKMLDSIEKAVRGITTPSAANATAPNSATLTPPGVETAEDIKRAEELLQRAKLHNRSVDIASAEAPAGVTLPPAAATPAAVATPQSIAPLQGHQPTPAPAPHPRLKHTPAPHTPHRLSKEKAQKSQHEAAAVSTRTAADLSRLGDHCRWTPRGFRGKASYDLRPLHVADETKLSYHITNNDGTTSLHPHELDYSFLWNLCGDVTPPTEPLHGANVEGICRDDQRGAVIQYANRTAQGFTMCHVIGRYDPGK